MVVKKQITRPDHLSINVQYSEPDICPVCKHAIKPETLSLTYYEDSSQNAFLAGLFLCHNCYQSFVGQYRIEEAPTPPGGFVAHTVYVEPDRYSPRTFDPMIKALSTKFVDIYNQALAAESHHLDQIAGVGYRKAFEFLIKDYLISRTEDDSEKGAIRKMYLGECINQKVSNDRLKTTASRCVWLGNDHTHYYQLFTEYDLEYLKKLINASVHWISMELLTDDAALIEPRNH